MRNRYDADKDGKITEKDISIYQKLEELDGARARRKLKMRLIYGASSIVGIVVVSSLFLPASQVEVMTKMLDTIFKYIPFAG